MLTSSLTLPKALLSSFLLVLAASCSGVEDGEDGSAGRSSDKTAPSGTPPVKVPAPDAGAPAAGAMDAAIAELMAKPEQPDTSITVQHVLIAYKGAPRITGVSRSKEEAKVLAETVWHEALSGADFKTLMKTHSNDSGGGEYPMTKAGRTGMVAGFGDVGFRLNVGEIGVAPWHQSASPYGWHIIKRVK